MAHLIRRPHRNAHSARWVLRHCGEVEQCAESGFERFYGFDLVPNCCHAKHGKNAEFRIRQRQTQNVCQHRVDVRVLFSDCFDQKLLLINTKRLGEGGDPVEGYHHIAGLRHRYHVGMVEACPVGDLPLGQVGRIDCSSQAVGFRAERHLSNSCCIVLSDIVLAGGQRS